MTRLAVAAVLGLVIGATPALGQTGASRDRCRSLRETLNKLSVPLSLETDDVRLADFMTWFEASTRLELNIAWIDDDSGGIDGLDPEMTVSANFKEIPAMDALQRVLDRASSDGFGGEDATWQLTQFGEVQVGPKSRLNKSRRVEIYDIGDLVLETPVYDEAPNLDLNTALRSGQGGGGRSPFRATQQTDPDRIDFQDRVDGLVEIIQGYVEPEQWESNGGDGAFLRVWKTGLLVNAPDYIHRQINGYHCGGF